MKFSSKDILRWSRAPLWILAVLTGAKSFADNPILGSKRLNTAGLHVWRLRTAHALARWRRARLARGIPAQLKKQFDSDGYIVIRDFLSPELFRSIQRELLDPQLECRSQQQGDTITHRIPVGPRLRHRLPGLAK